LSKLDCSFDNFVSKEELGGIRYFYYIYCMSAAKKNTKAGQKKSSTNPFIKLVEDKKKITAAIQSGKSLSSLKEIKFVKPI